MHPIVFREFERICRERGAGGDVLEIGAVPSPDTLLCLEALAHATSRTGLNLDGPHRFRGFEIHRGDANAMDLFPDDRFDTVLCNATLEHDPRFWRTLAEIRRVGRPDALVVLGTPGYSTGGPVVRLRAVVRRLSRIPLLGRRLRPLLATLNASTLTLLVHDFPGDYYRFSPQAFREVLLDGMREVEVRTVMDPPRIIGAGRLP